VRNFAVRLSRLPLTPALSRKGRGGTVRDVLRRLAVYQWDPAANFFPPRLSIFPSPVRH
jgi:hypothetical protein